MRVLVTCPPMLGLIDEFLPAFAAKGLECVPAKVTQVMTEALLKLGFEIKFSSAPKVTKGFWQACDDVGVSAAYIVAPVQTGWVVREGVEVIAVTEIPERLGQMQ